MTPELKDSYFQRRMQKLGITEETNKVGILQNDIDTGKNVVKDIPVFRESDHGIDILVYSLDRNIIRYKSDNSKQVKPYYLTRLKNPITKKDGSVQKYNIPKGQGTFPFFHPSLIDKFEKQQPIDTLFVTEGYFKAWKGCMHGIDVVGVSSITHLREKETGKLHTDIRKLRDVCRVKRMVWLTDGDCLDITNKDLTDGVDLFKRPKNFFNSCETFRDLLDDWDGDTWFFHPESDGIISMHREQKITRDDCKGLDDLLIAFPDKVAEIVADSQTVSGEGRWFHKMNISRSLNKVWHYFHLANVNDFYLFHIDRRPEMKNVEFVFNGTRYQYDDKDKTCKVIVPADAKKYFRVGDTYYKRIEKINQFGEKEHAFEKRQKETIKDDHGRTFTKHIAKYESFCNVPGHTDYQNVIHENYNVYFPFEHEPDQDECTEDDCPTIINFLKHIFGQQMIKVKQRDGEMLNTANYQLALDYIQLMYLNPTQRLPILCLVSRENETGKSTFGDLMKAIFTNNATVVGNADLADDFNSFWATKLLIMCDEAKIDKQMVVEKVKSLNFAKKIGLNAKGKDKVEIDFFGKFMFFTNNEENFIYASEEDLRYWVIKVPKIKEKNPDLLPTMISEIPQFLSMLNHRKYVAPRFTRMWFHPDLLKTEALKKVVENSHSTVKKELTHHLREMFLDFGLKEIFMTNKTIKELFFRNKEENYIERVLKEEMKIKPVQWFIYDGRKFDEESNAIAAAMADGHPELDALRLVKAQSRMLRYKYPKWDYKTEIGKAPVRVPVWISDIGRAYKFRREEFVTPDEAVDLPDEIKQLADDETLPGPPNDAEDNSHPAQDGPVDELPF